MRWTSDETKNRINQRKHRLSFETAQLAFNDPLALSRPDPYPGEERWRTIGIIGTVAVLVVHTWPDPVRRVAKKRAASLAHERRRRMKEEHMKKARSNGLSERQRAEIEALAALPEDQINTQDLPEVRDWTGAKRGLFYRPVKQQITLRIDADVLAWFKSRAAQGKGYQTDINRALRDYVQRRERGAR